MYEDDYAMDDESRPDSPQSYQTGEGGSLPPSPGFRNRSPPGFHRRAASADARLERKLKVAAEIVSATSGVVNPEEEEDFRQGGKLAPHKPLGECDIAEAWDILASQDRIWFPLPIAWWDVPELEGCAVFFDKYPTPFPEPREYPDVEIIHSFEKGISNQTLKGVRSNIKRIGPLLLQTLRRCIVPSDVPLDATEVRMKVREVPPVNPFPSHLLIIEQDPPVRGERVRSYVPIHDIVLLAYVTNVDLPPRLPHNPRQLEDTVEVTLPIVRLGLPSPAIFNKLLAFLYSANQQGDQIAFFDSHMGYAGLPDNARIEAAASIPRLVRTAFLKKSDQEQWITFVRTAESRLAAQLSMTYSYERLIHLMKDVNLQHENAISLGLNEGTTEISLLICRRLLLSALTLSVVRDHLIQR